MPRFQTGVKIAHREKRASTKESGRIKRAELKAEAVKKLALPAVTFLSQRDRTFPPKGIMDAQSDQKERMGQRSTRQYAPMRRSIE